MPNRGKLVILAIIALACAATAGALFVHRERARRPLEFWGSPTTLLIARAPMVEVLRLRSAERPSDAALPGFTIDGDRWIVEKRQRCDGGRGLSNIRRALLEDGSFDWNEPAASFSPEWRHGLGFIDGDNRVTLLFSLDCPRSIVTDRAETISIRPFAPSLAGFLNEQFSQD